MLNNIKSLEAYHHLSFLSINSKDFLEKNYKIAAAEVIKNNLKNFPVCKYNPVDFSTDCCGFRKIRN